MRTVTPPAWLMGLPKLSTPAVTGNQGCRGISRRTGVGLLVARRMTMRVVALLPRAKATRPAEPSVALGTPTARAKRFRRKGSVAFCGALAVTGGTSGVSARAGAEGRLEADDS